MNTKDFYSEGGSGCHAIPPPPSYSPSVRDLTVVFEQCCLLQKSVLISGHTEGGMRKKEAFTSFEADGQLMG